MPVPATNWRATSFLIVAAVTLFRVVSLKLSNADLYVDEAQYWLWGQNLDFGYFSKPPLIGWVIRAVTDLAGSSSAFWIRIPAPLFHGLTALILAVWARRQFDAGAAIWVAAIYVTLPIVAVGSIQISTDTIMAPFLALGLLFHRELLASGKIRYAVLTGGSVGLAIMAKYAGAYFLLGAILSAVFVKSYRISIKNSAALFGVLALVVSPNIIWNLQNDLTTLEHTLDNVNWVRGASAGLSLNFVGLGEFILSQFVAMGPIVFALLLYFGWRTPANLHGLMFFSLPVIVIVCVQALLSKANANWAFAAFPAAILLVVPWMVQRAWAWLWGSLAINVVVAVTLPLLLIFADRLGLDGEGTPFVQYVGRDEVSIQILDAAKQNGSLPIVAASRSVLADLFLTGRNQDFRIYSVAGNRRPRDYFQQKYPFVSDGRSDVLFVTGPGDLICNDKLVAPLIIFDLEDTAYGGLGLRAYKLSAECQHLMR